MQLNCYADLLLCWLADFSRESTRIFRPPQSHYFTVGHATFKPFICGLHCCISWIVEYTSHAGCFQCRGAINISFGSGFAEPQIRITALAPAPAPTRTFLRPLDFFFFISQIVLFHALKIIYFDLSTFLRGFMQP